MRRCISGDSYPVTYSFSSCISHGSRRSLARLQRACRAPRTNPNSSKHCSFYKSARCGLRR